MQERLASARVAHLATVGPDGPHVVPITFAIAAGTLFTAIDAKPKSGRPLRRLDNIRAEPRVAVLSDHYEEDWERLWWVRLDGLARVLEPGAEAEAGLAALASKYRQYVTQPRPGPVIAVSPVRWTGWTGESPGT